MKLNVKIGLLAAACALSACSVLEGDRIDYKSAGKGVTLEVPPDLSQLSRDSRYVVPGYGHIDCIFGRNAVNDVYPKIVEHLEQTARVPFRGQAAAE